MVKSERINFKASKLAPNPLEFSYWIDLSTDYNGKVIRVFNPNTELWERMSTGGNGGGVSADVLDSINREIERLLLGKQNLLTAGEGININNDIISVTIDTDEFITRTEAKNLYLPKGNYTTEHYVDTKVASLVDTAPEALNTLNELAAALGDDPNFATTVSNEIGKKLDKSTYNTDKATFALKTEVPTDYYTKSAVDNRLANKADTSNVYSKTEVNNLLNTKQNKLVSGTTIKTINGVSLLGNGDIIVEGGSGSVDLSNYYTKDQTYDRSTIDSKIAAGGTFDSTNYYTKSQVDAAIENVEVDLTGYATEAWVTSKGYLTQHQDISGKANVSDVYTKSQTDSEIDTKVSALVNQAPETLNTLNELATALGNDPNFATTVSNLIGTKLNKTGGVMQGNLDFDETYKLSGIVNPTEEDDATNKRYVDTAIQNSLSNVEVNVPMATETTAGVIKIWKGTAVVLGRWNLGDVLPSWVKDSMEFWYDVKKLKATNESLSANPQLTDFSGNDRPLLLYNFAFSGMSGVNGYDTDFRNWIKNDNFQQYSQYISDNKIILSKYQGNGYIIRLNTDVESFKINVTGIDKIGIAYIRNNIDGTSNTVSITKDGVYTLQKSYAKENNPTGFSYAYNPDLLKTETNITIELIPNYPDALVTDGVDDYGVVLNMDYGVKTLFYVFTSKSYKMNNYIYDQRPSRFQIFTGISNYICYRVNENTVTYLNGKLNKEINTLEIVNIKHIATIVAPSDDYDSSQPYFFRSQSGSNLGECAFYSAIGFNRVLTQEEIDWVIENMIDKTDIDMNLIPTE